MSDELFSDAFFADEETAVANSREKIKVLIVDDEKEVHTVTGLALSDFDFDGQELTFLHAYSGAQAKEILSNEPDVAVILLDVVMETDDAGLKLAHWIRKELKNENVRIVLRTGQPGQAPERTVIPNYDINDYKAKTELTSQKMYTLMYTALRSYNHIVTLERNKHGMEKVIEATKNIIGKVGFLQFVQATLDQLASLIGVSDSVVLSLDAQAFALDNSSVEVLCSTGEYHHYKDFAELNDVPFKDLIIKAITKNETQYRGSEMLMLCQNKFNIAIFYINNAKGLSELDQHLLNIFAENVSIALENTSLNEQLKTSQREVIYRLSEVIENRSKETGNHVKRVAKYSELLGRLYGLPANECEILMLASPLHDIGKVGIPDAILHKPGKLEGEEWEIMKTHAKSGQNMLAGTKQILLETGSVIAGTHHERWDGKGYPLGTAGEEIPIVGRITALADIFDALGSRRCYKEPWDNERIIEFIKTESGGIFDPTLVKLMLDNLPAFLVIQDTLRD